MSGESPTAAAAPPRGNKIRNKKRGKKQSPAKKRPSGAARAKAAKAKKAALLVDHLGRAFPPAPGELKSPHGPPTDKGGRPYAIKDVAHAISTLEGLGAIMATSKECSAVLKISEPTLFAFFKRFPLAREAWEGGKQQGKASLRRSQFKLAERNATMGIFLGMQYLDQKDKRAFSGDPANPIKHQHSGAVKTTVEHDYSSLPLDELVRLHAQGVGGKKGDD